MRQELQSKQAEDAAKPDHSTIYVSLGNGREMLLVVTVTRSRAGSMTHDAPTVAEIQEAGRSLELLAFHTQSSL